MCFSTEASFTTAIVLGGMSVATFKNVSSRSQLFLAAIPLLFALQQLAEGFVWLHISHNISSTDQFVYAQRAFLTFSFLIWPIWIPLSLALAEPVLWRRSLLYLNLACGIALSVTNLIYGIKQAPSVQVVHHSLQYLGQMPAQAIAYPVIVLFPCVISSLKNIWVFGLLVAIGYGLAGYFYFKTFVSVWCFLAAIVSLSIYKILKDNKVRVRKRFY